MSDQSKSQTTQRIQRYAVMATPPGGLSSIMSVHDTREAAEAERRKEQDGRRFERGVPSFSVALVEYHADG